MIPAPARVILKGAEAAAACIYCDVKNKDGADFNLGGQLFQKVLESRNNDFVK